MSVKLKERYNIEPQNHSSKSLRKNNCNDRAQNHFLESWRNDMCRMPKIILSKFGKWYKERMLHHSFKGWKKIYY